ncbi:hypothetical protein [Gemmiger formicilis]|uniref:hypothetical protein n=1 Tax=Gemmiger formicilis TaxID=745368 RepID=UPI003521153C
MEELKKIRKFLYFMPARTRIWCEPLKFRPKISEKRGLRTDQQRKIKAKLTVFWAECRQVQASVLYYKRQKQHFAQVYQIRKPYSSLFLPMYLTRTAGIETSYYEDLIQS